MKGLCDDCDAAVINGTLCHEHGCPTASREKREARQAEVDDDESRARPLVGDRTRMTSPSADDLLGGVTIKPKKMARIMMWAVEWADTDEYVDSPYSQGTRETIGHVLACWLTQCGGWDCYETAEATGLIPWDEVQSWDVERWCKFLEEQRHPGDGE